MRNTKTNRCRLPATTWLDNEYKMWHKWNTLVPNSNAALSRYPHDERMVQQKLNLIELQLPGKFKMNMVCIIIKIMFGFPKNLALKKCSHIFDNFEQTWKTTNNNNEKKTRTHPELSHRRDATSRRKTRCWTTLRTSRRIVANASATMIRAHRKTTNRSADCGCFCRPHRSWCAI